MKCTLRAMFGFLYMCSVCGSAYAIISKGMQYFSPITIIALRMFFGFLGCLVVLIFRIMRKNHKETNLKQFLYPGAWPVVHIVISGLSYQGVGHTMIAFSQKWVSSAMVQVVFALIPVLAAVTAHTTLPDEKCNSQLSISLVFSVIGVVFSTYPSLSHPSKVVDSSHIVLGYVLIFLSVFIWGISTAYMKVKTVSYDLMVVSTYQLFSSAIFCCVFALIYDGPKSFISQCRNAPLMGWLSPVFVGVFASGLLMPVVHTIIKEIGSVGSNFGVFGQIIVGMIVGSLWLHEWDKYTKWDVISSIFGVLLIGMGIFSGFSPENEQIDDEPLISSVSHDNE